MTIKDTIKHKINQVLADRYKLEGEQFSVEYPREDRYGDYASNAAMILAKKFGTNPMEIGTGILEEIKRDNYFKGVELVQPGFLNFHLSDRVLKDGLEKVVSGKYKKELKRVLKGKRYLLEHTSANPVHTVHIGHLRNNFVGMSAYRLLQALGAKVELDYLNNDRGTNVARAMIGYLAFADKRLAGPGGDYLEQLKSLKVSDEKIEHTARDFNWKQALDEWARNPGQWLSPEDIRVKSDYFDLCIYSPGARAAKMSEEFSRQVQEMLILWENEDKNVRRLWKLIIKWSWDGYQQTLRRIGSKIDQVWNESDYYLKGKKWVDKGLEQGIFRRLEDGAVISDLDQFGLSDVVLLKSSGASLYHTQDFGLAELKIKKYNGYDKYIWCIGADQKLYLEQLYVMVDQLGIASKDKLFHLSYGFLRLKSGKMSSRVGNVVNADELMDAIKAKAMDLMKSSGTDRGLAGSEIDEAAERVMLGALKYGLLKYSREKDFAFDIEESLSLSGNSGPYLQYAYARCQSILNKHKGGGETGRPADFNEEERALAAGLVKAEEIITEAGQNYSPHLVCDYLHKLSKLFNGFYETNRVIGSDNEVMRIRIVRVAAELIKFGLEILGIHVLDKM